MDFFTLPEAKGKKDQKSEFVGFAEMNKRIQGALGKSTEAADRKRMLKLNEQQKENLDEVVEAGRGHGRGFKRHRQKIWAPIVASVVRLTTVISGRPLRA
jgi:hypothetical protein